MEKAVVVLYNEHVIQIGRSQNSGVRKYKKITLFR